MQVEAVMFANRAAVDGWLLAVEGAGWEHYDLPFFPATVSGFVAGVLALDGPEQGDLSQVTLEVFSDSGQVEGSRQSMIAIGTRPKTAHGVPYRVAFAIPFMTVVKEPTVVKARLIFGEDELAAISFSARGGVPDSLPDDL